MFPELIHSLLSNIWAIFLVALFFGCSIFVHELGHYLAARRRGVHVERFSIGFGPPIWSWRSADGVQFQISWFPLGGYVILPQLADLGIIEGESTTEAATLPPVKYADKLVVFAAGAAFNILFAFALACIIWVVGQPESEETASTVIGYVSRMLDLPDNSRIISPAAAAGLQVGDKVVAIDGQRVLNWFDLNQALIASAGRDAQNQPRTVFTILRGGQTLDIVLHPRISTEDEIRRVGIAPGYDLNVYAVTPGSSSDRAGMRPGDQILTFNGTREMNVGGFAEDLSANPRQPASVVVRRNGAQLTLTLPPRDGPKESAGIEFLIGHHLAHPSPFAQISDQVITTFRTLWALINPHSDIGLSKMTGPVGIVHIFHEAAEAGLRTVLMFTILVNVNLAVFNLLPIPVLDGGQMLFATIGRLRGRSLPINFIVTMQGFFAVFIGLVILYLSVFDVKRWYRDSQADRAAAAEAAAPMPGKAPAPARP